MFLENFSDFFWQLFSSPELVHFWRHLEIFPQAPNALFGFLMFQNIYEIFSSNFGMILHIFLGSKGIIWTFIIFFELESDYLKKLKPMII